MTVGWKVMLSLAAGAVIAAGAVWVYSAAQPSPTPGLQPAPVVVGPPVVEASEQSVRELCVRCHVYPPPDSFPRDIWRQEIRQAYRFIRDAKVPGPLPSEESVTLFYESRAPQLFPAI